MQPHQAFLVQVLLPPEVPCKGSVLPLFNAKGYFAVIGSQSIAQPGRTGYTGVAQRFLNDIWSHISPKPDIQLQARYTNFSGEFGHLRFWSKALTRTEAIEHARNFKSLGVEDPMVNFNFATTPSGSFGKLRLDISTDQPLTESSLSGELTLTDFSQQFPASGATQPFDQKTVPGMAGLEPLSRIIKPSHFAYSYFNPNFDERGTTNKVRIRSFQDWENVKLLGGGIAPIYEVPRSEIPTDDTRFSVEASVVQALDEDIIKIFATLEKFNEYIGRPELLFAGEYRDLRNMRNVYFNRLTGKINIRTFFEIFKWLDDSFGMLVEKLLPSKTNFLGMNFIIESHMLERSKFRYGYVGSYLPTTLTVSAIPAKMAFPTTWMRYQVAYAFNQPEGGLDE